MARPSSFGNCELCGSRIGKSSMALHLRKCLPREGDVATVEALLIRVQAPGAPMYWMDCAVRIDTNLKQLDTLLRRRWLECCGHLSEFSAGKRRRIGMSVSIEKALALGGNRFDYEYDFGSTTALVVSALGPVEVALAKSIRLLARNEPPIWACDECGAPASEVCTQCQFDEGGFCCAKHATRHECGPDMLLPVVNSPRMGVCGYTGES